MQTQLKIDANEGVTLYRALLEYRRILNVSALAEGAEDILDAEQQRVAALMDRVILTTMPETAVHG